MSEINGKVVIVTGASSGLGKAIAHRLAKGGAKLVLPTMREQHGGQIINLSSVAGHKVFPASAVYSATKYAVKALSEGLRQEGDGEIHSTNISPGAVATELTRQAQRECPGPLRLQQCQRRHAVRHEQCVAWP
ncbi:SDR family oxidoreductase [Marinobacter orientalis]|uniref:SDR family NAD(P)-dependent oxidoreductase n=1 Tax=Marinobacter orientalis TaxID=1928859 RepID=A0A7Y0NLR6_9GAMM|nr:SDR family NAD(P)-dependent oxidoreductase [Marinobacter orientalis]NMT62888.1 SDR family NAD(P)-dependent oxidoreductase [Marinobacter orientalis]TGX51562.1 SDR family NAD(P)-dependent oxidoreductase [Marinobacter orientalis]